MTSEQIAQVLHALIVTCGQCGSQMARVLDGQKDFLFLCPKENCVTQVNVDLSGDESPENQENQEK